MASVNDVGLALDDFEAIERRYSAPKQRVVTEGYYGSANVPIADIQMAGSQVLLDRPEKKASRDSGPIVRLGAYEGPPLPNQAPLLQSTRLLDPRNSPAPDDYDTPESLRQKN